MYYSFKYLIIFICILYSSSFSQIRDNYIISETGSNPVIVVDSNNELHVSWASEEGIFYLYLDSMGVPLQTSIKFYNSELSNLPQIAINKDKTIIVWKKGSFTYNSYIWGNIFTVGTDTLNNNIQFNDIYFDAERSSPDVCFLSDSIFIVVWSGEGPETSSSTGVYGQLCSTQGNFIGNNLLLSDHFGYNLLYSESCVLKFPNQDKFIVIWRDDHLGKNMIFGREFYIDGSPIDSSFVINDSLQNNNLWFVSADMSNTGDFVVVWGAKLGDDWTIQWRWYNSECEPYSHVENITGIQDSVLEYSFVDVAIDGDGKGIVVWEQIKNGYSRIYAQRFLCNKELVGNSFCVSSKRMLKNQYFPRVDIFNSKIYTIWKEAEIWSNIIDYNNPPTHIYIKPHSQPSSDYTLFNYPNPFNNQTVIQFQIAKKGAWSLTVYNLAGQKVESLFYDKVYMPGQYSIKWRCNMPSGIYFIHLSNGNTKQIIKTILLK